MIQKRKIQFKIKNKMQRIKQESKDTVSTVGVPQMI